jgi:hypothetical protein
MSFKAWVCVGVKQFYVIFCLLLLVSMLLEASSDSGEGSVIGI